VTITYIFRFTFHKLYLIIDTHYQKTSN